MQIIERAALDWSELNTMRGGKSFGGALTLPLSANYLPALVHFVLVACAPAFLPNVRRAVLHHILGLAMVSRACVRFPLPRLAGRVSHAEGNVLITCIAL